MTDDNQKFLLIGGAALVVAAGIYWFTSSKQEVATKKSIYERVGGKDAIQAVIDIAIPALREDKELAHFFTKMPLEYHKKMQFKFFTTALGGPKLYDGMSMKEAHKGRGITSRHFQLVCEYVVKALQ